MKLLIDIVEVCETACCSVEDLCGQHAGFTLNFARFGTARLKDPNRHIAFQSVDALFRMFDSRARLA